MIKMKNRKCIMCPKNFNTPSHIDTDMCDSCEKEMFGRGDE